jgi:hypothetical protein
VARQESRHGYFETASGGFEGKNVRAAIKGGVGRSWYEARARISPAEFLQPEPRIQLSTRQSG